jgi:hypothetical protein
LKTVNVKHCRQEIDFEEWYAYNQFTAIYWAGSTHLEVRGWRSQGQLLEISPYLWMPSVSNWTYGTSHCRWAMRQ